MERISESLKPKCMTAGQAATFIHTGMTLACSGFTSAGHPKAVPQALAQLGTAQNLTLLTGASVGDELDGVLARAGLIARRYPYMSSPDLRRFINQGKTGYADFHLSHIATAISRGDGPEIDIAIIEAAAVTPKGILVGAAGGWSDTQVRMAKQVIVEVNEAIPLAMAGMHDFFEIGVPPHARMIPIISPDSRIGTDLIPCPPEKIAAIVCTNQRDIPAKFKPGNAAAQAIGENVVAFLKDEVKAGRLPQELGPIQSGVGQVANAVLNGLSTGGFTGLTMYTETLQDTALQLIKSGVFRMASTCAVSLGAEAQADFYEHLDFYRDRIIIRSQEISNHPEVIRRLGLIALNTPIEVDIYGNVNSTHTMGSSIMNGIGGSGDFARNARLNIFATESLAKNGAISCIVPLVSHVDHTEHDTQVIITEQGVADLRWKTPLERAHLLIENCAHPDYRPLLWVYLERAIQVSQSQHEPMDLEQALSWHQRFLTTGSMK